MRLTWHGHSCFTLECQDGLLVFDASVPSLKPLHLTADLVLCSSNHNVEDTIKLNKQNHHFLFIVSIHQYKNIVLKL